MGKIQNAKLDRMKFEGNIANPTGVQNSDALFQQEYNRK